jgi:hypothetical protein
MTRIARRREVKNILRRLTILLTIVAASLVAGCGLWTVSTTDPTPPNTMRDRPLVIVETRGGECPRGPCGSTIAIDPDGRVHATAPTRADLGMLSEANLDALQVEVARADFAVLESRPFTDTCPTAFDGQETIYTFATASGAVRIASCEVVVDPAAPLYVAVAAALAGVARP